MPFQKGQSGNPGGRAKLEGEALEVRTMARKLTTKAISTLEECLDAKERKVRVMAAEALLNRGWGRPVQAIEHLVPAGAVEIRIISE
jgi:hypothetical protein